MNFLLHSALPVCGMIMLMGLKPSGKEKYFPYPVIGERYGTKVRMYGTNVENVGEHWLKQQPGAKFASPPHNCQLSSTQHRGGTTLLKWMESTCQYKE